ncbi:ABC transporter substrate-binding protein [Nocardia sp. ET3-3]|uniref:ABC transporter substrate-binding protein n=1 Tax=Nocardia terrae TaxID=2675851 RepID=A0A7K1VA28_9NOCA|nr:ABC transporter substrate-binding protein [Nocardia terrae]MVU83510.1 ABC transporter substrate-binding protein [Nocardia terrae]
MATVGPGHVVSVGAVGVAAVALVAGLASACSNDSSGSNSDTVYFGVSGPKTGGSAEYGRLWQQGFDLALDEINAAGGINGKKVALKWEDSQSDPKQAVPIATKFVGDRSIIAELGDFSSPASIAASPVYNRGKLVQYGFTNGGPEVANSVADVLRDIYYGTPDEVAEQLAADTALRDSADFIVQVHPVDPGHAATLRSIELIATKVAPQLGWRADEGIHP